MSRNALKVSSQRMNSSGKGRLPQNNLAVPHPLARRGCSSPLDRAARDRPRQATVARGQGGAGRGRGEVSGRHTL